MLEFVIVSEQRTNSFAAIFFLSFKTKFAVLDYKSLDKFGFEEWPNSINKSFYDCVAIYVFEGAK